MSNFLSYLRKILQFSLKTAIFAIVFAAAVVGTFYGYDYYSNRPTAAKHWATEALPALGVQYSLSTEWQREDGLLYRFDLRPLDKTYEEGFSSIANTSEARKGGFTVSLLDAGGFEVKNCAITIEELVPLQDKDGKLKGMQAQGNISGCSRQRYLSAVNQSVLYTFKKIPQSPEPLKSTPSPTKQDSQPKATEKPVTKTLSVGLRPHGMKAIFDHRVTPKTRQTLLDVLNANVADESLSDPKCSIAFSTVDGEFVSYQVLCDGRTAQSSHGKYLSPTQVADEIQHKW